VVLPSGLSATEGCNGTVTIRIKHGNQTVSTPAAKLKANCAYSVSKTLNLAGRGTLAVTATFGGNARLTTESHRSITAKRGNNRTGGGRP